MKSSNQAMHALYEVLEDDAIGMLIADHKRVARLFADFKRLNEAGRDKEKAAVVREICLQLTVHTQLEEEIFYPAVRQATSDQEQMDEALVEHAGAKQLIAQLSSAAPDDDLYDARVTVLNEQIDHHVQEEEGSMFPKARHSGLDTRRIGAAMLGRKKELLKGNPGAAVQPKMVGQARDDDGEARKENRPRVVKAKKKVVKTKAPSASKRRRNR